MCKDTNTHIKTTLIRTLSPTDRVTRKKMDSCFHCTLRESWRAGGCGFTALSCTTTEPAERGKRPKQHVRPAGQRLDSLEMTTGHRGEERDDRYV